MKRGGGLALALAAITSAFSGGALHSRVAPAAEQAAVVIPSRGKGKGRSSRSVALAPRYSRSRYTPHQGKGEMARRRRQMAAGTHGISTWSATCGAQELAA